MSFISYAQNFEDVMLWRAFKGVERGFYIDVGAQDPDVGSVTRAFYDKGWSGINIEPVSRYYDELCRARPRDVNLRLVCGSDESERHFFEIPDTGLSTLDPAIAERHRGAGWKVLERRVSQRRLSDIWSQHVKGDVHFLKIDAEGAEQDVLHGAMLDRHRPWIVVIEAVAPLTQDLLHQHWEHFLVDAGYAFVYFDGLNRFYVATERKALEAGFAAPPNCFDDFVRVAEHDAVAQLAELKNRIGQAVNIPSERSATAFNPAAAPFLASSGPQPTLAQPASQLCTEGQFREPVYADWCTELHETVMMHRKQWEFVYILQALQIHGKLQPGMRGLGFGCGKEPLAAVMAKRGCEVVATDLDAAAVVGKGWAESGQHASQLEDLNARGICEPEQFRSLVSFRAQNMNEISPDLTGFDFVWSSCAFEHVGSIARGLQFVMNAMRCLKPGGIAVHTTEFNLTSNFTTLETPDLVIFRKHDIEHLVRQLERSGHEVQPLNLNPGSGELDRHVDLPPYKQEPHLRLMLDRYVTTSIGLIVRAK